MNKAEWNKITSLWKQAKAHFLADENVQAQSALNQALKNFRGDDSRFFEIEFEIRKDLLKFLMAQKHYADAAKEIDRLFQHTSQEWDTSCPELAILHHYRGLILSEAKQFRPAAESFKKALALWEKSHSASHVNAMAALSSLIEVLSLAKDSRGVKIYSDKYKKLRSSMG